MKDKLLKEYYTQYSTNDIKISIENLSYDWFFKKNMI
jgi:hypothetical protein